MIFSIVTTFIDYMKCHTHDKVYIWGAGVYGDEIGQLLTKNAIAWNGYYDNYLTFEQSLNKKPVFLGKDLKGDNSSLYIIAVIKNEAVRQQLRANGVPEDRMIWFDASSFWADLRDNITGNTDYSKEIKKFHNIHQGERCFIIGNGPSLSLKDLETIHSAGIISFACNSISNCLSQTSWSPDYYCVVDAMFIRDVFQDKRTLLATLGSCKYMFARSDSSLFRYYNDADIKNLVFCKIAVPKSLSDFEFSEDCAEKIYTGYTVTYIMFQLAAFMGFSEIYLLGMDHHFSYEVHDDGGVCANGHVQNHMEEMRDSHPLVAPIDKMTRAYECARRYANAHGIQIYNATRGGKLEVFPRVDFDALF